MNMTITTTAMAIARSTLRRRIRQEEAVLGEMLKRGNYKSLSYQAGLVDGLLIAASLTAVLDQEAEVDNGNAH